jgi:hypothetical protein
MFKGAVKSLDNGMLPLRPKKGVGGYWGDWMTYNMWHKSLSVFEVNGCVGFMMIGSSEPGPTPLMATGVPAYFDIAGARLLRDRLNEAIQAAEARSEAGDGVDSENKRRNEADFSVPAVSARLCLGARAGCEGGKMSEVWRRILRR